MGQSGSRDTSPCGGQDRQTTAQRTILKLDPDGAGAEPSNMLKTSRIVLLGNTGVGKSSLANTIIGDDVFKINHSSIGGTSECQAGSKCVHGRRLTVVDTPGFFDTERPEEQLKREIVRCTTECAPGPHALFIVLKVGKFTEEEQAVITRICHYFSEEALKYAAVVFTHGDQLPKGMHIEQFVDQDEGLSDLVKKCGGRCHVVDNKYWKNQQDEYRSNKFQVLELLNTTDKIVMENRGGCYTSKMLTVWGEKEEVDTETEEEKAGGNAKKVGLALAAMPLLLPICPIGAIVGAVVLTRKLVRAIEGKEHGGEVKEEGEETETKGENAGEDTEKEGEKAGVDTEKEGEKAGVDTEKEGEKAGGKTGLKKLGLGIGGVMALAATPLLWPFAAAAGTIGVAVTAGTMGVVGPARAARVVGPWVLQKVYQWTEDWLRLSATTLLVVAFYSLLLLSFGVLVPFAGTLLLQLGQLLMFLLVVLLLLLL